MHLCNMHHDRGMRPHPRLCTTLQTLDAERGAAWLLMRVCSDSTFVRMLSRAYETHANPVQDCQPARIRSSGTPRPLSHVPPDERWPGLDAEHAFMTVSPRVSRCHGQS